MTEEKKTQAIDWKSQFKQDMNVYEFEATLPGSQEKLMFKPITTKALKKLLVYENARTPGVIETALDQIITSSVLTEGFDVTSLYLDDRFYLLLEIRKKSKGDMYQFDYTCPECKSQSIQSVNLAKLKVGKLKKSYSTLVPLTDNISIHVDHLTRGQQIEVYNKVDSSKSDQEQLVTMTLMSMAAAIKSIETPDGTVEEPTLEDRMFLLDELPQQLTEKIKDWFEKNQFGADMNFKRKCPHCYHEETMTIPLSDFFVA